MTPAQKTELKLGIGKIPEILLDNTDRNRTSPFAFTGNRFEFRAVGSSANCGAAMIVLNAAVAHQLRNSKKKSTRSLKREGIRMKRSSRSLRNILSNHESVLFEGDNYSHEWHAEAARRKLCNIASVPESLKCYLNPDAKEVLIGSGIFRIKNLKAVLKLNMRNSLKRSRLNQEYWATWQLTILFRPQSVI